MIVLTLKPIWKNFTLTCTSLTIAALSVSCSGPNAVEPNGTPVHAQAKPVVAPAVVLARPSSEAEIDNWRSMMLGAPKPENACLVASYPERRWREIPCVKAPNEPLVPAHGFRRATVGNGVDYSAEVTGHVTDAEGWFHNITGVKSESSQGVANGYSLQINTQFFTTTTCKTLKSPDPNCQGWEQFVYRSDAVGTYIQYWLLNFGPKGTMCPSGWTSFHFPKGTEIYCYINSAETPTPLEPITSLGNLILEGFAYTPSRDSDFGALFLRNTGAFYFVNGSNWFPDLYAQWQEAEFNVFGNCCGDEAKFNTGSTIGVRTQVDSGTSNAPTCDGPNGGFTGETNNLFLTGTSRKWPKKEYPAIIFTESNAAHRTQASCATEGS